MHGPSGREDLNLRLPGPEPGALPGCATPRKGRDVYPPPHTLSRNSSNLLALLRRAPCHHPHPPPGAPSAIVRSMRRSSLAAVALSLACSADPAPAPTPAPAATVAMDFRADAPFFAAPFPSEHRRGAAGYRLDGLPAAAPSAYLQGILALAQDADGFATTGGVFLTTTAPLDAASLPDLAASVTPGASVFLTPVDGPAPARARVPLRVTFHAPDAPSRHAQPARGGAPPGRPPRRPRAPTRSSSRSASAPPRAPPSRPPPPSRRCAPTPPSPASPTTSPRATARRSPRSTPLGSATSPASPSSAPAHPPRPSNAASPAPATPRRSA